MEILRAEVIQVEDRKKEELVPEKDLYENKQIVKEYLETELPIIKLVECDATYLLWLDCSALNVSSKVLSEFLRQNQCLPPAPKRPAAE